MKQKKILKSKIFIRNLRLPVLIGVHKQERVKPQSVRFDLWITFRRLEKIKDTLETTICYDTLVEAVRTVSSHKAPLLLETLAEDICAHLLQKKEIKKVKIRLQKPDLYDFSVGVELTRSAVCSD